MTDPLTIAKEVLGNRLHEYVYSDFDGVQYYTLDGYLVRRSKVIEAANRCLLSKGGEPLA